MPSPFEEVAAEADAAVDETYGEMLRIVPMVASRYGADVPDVTRAVREIIGAFIENQGQTKILDNAGSGRDFDRKLLTPARQANFSLVALGGDRPRAPDRIVRIEKAGNPSYAISAVEPFGFARIACNLVEATA